ncbi:hypothetical protein [Desulfovibrio porci]|uniref:hypothetical protein n=1 Tax=Desulfovibrio porci TaxID=2605782 RepID=UPI003A8D6F79
MMIDFIVAKAYNMPMKNNALRKAFERRGLTPKDVAKRGGGLKYVTLYQQYSGLRPVGPRSAILYEQMLGIPKSELRPDLWPPEKEFKEDCHASQPV